MNNDSLLQFPCDFPIKVMGRGDSGFRALVMDLVRRRAPDLDETRVRVQNSRAGRYQSVTVVVNARARAQLDAIYQDLSGHPQIKLVL
ncbi:MAG: DUF493 domain-containing protein [Candidatus Contendobacter sp.]|nr:DUF493 domain-containing protein [Candidatus Contendobacter sp.]MDS4060230.1 DUF493 domain-containing protein [Candidatus Contendobacter sp.]